MELQILIIKFHFVLQIVLHSGFFFCFLKHIWWWFTWWHWEIFVAQLAKCMFLVNSTRMQPCSFCSPFWFKFTEKSFLCLWSSCRTWYRTFSFIRCPSQMNKTYQTLFYKVIIWEHSSQNWRTVTLMGNINNRLHHCITVKKPESPEWCVNNHLSALNYRLLRVPDKAL